MVVALVDVPNILTRDRFSSCLRSRLHEPPPRRRQASNHPLSRGARANVPGSATGDSRSGAVMMQRRLHRPLENARENAYQDLREESLRALPRIARATSSKPSRVASPSNNALKLSVRASRPLLLEGVQFLPGVPGKGRAARPAA